MLNKTLIPTVLDLWPDTTNLTRWGVHEPSAHPDDPDTLILDIKTSPSEELTLQLIFFAPDHLLAAAFVGDCEATHEMTLNPGTPTDILGWLGLVKDHLPDGPYL
jgi:hypothetical protein